MVHPSRKPRRTTQEVENTVKLVSEICTAKGIDRHKSRTMMSLARWIGRRKAPPTMGEVEHKFGMWSQGMINLLQHEGVLRADEAWRDKKPTMVVDYGKEDE